jgi:hypothetical protein
MGNEYALANKAEVPRLSRFWMNVIQGLHENCTDVGGGGAFALWLPVLDLKSEVSIDELGWTMHTYFTICVLECLGLLIGVDKVVLFRVGAIAAPWLRRIRLYGPVVLVLWGGLAKAAAA